MQLSGLGRARTVMSFTRWRRTEGAAQRCLVSWVWGILRLSCSLRAPRSSLVTRVLVRPDSLSVLVFLPESHTSTAADPHTWRPPVLPPGSAETWATDQTSPLPGSGSQPSHNYAVVTMYFSASKQGVFFNGISNQWNSGAKGQNLCSRGLLLLPSSLHLCSGGNKTKQELPTCIMQGRAIYWTFFFFLQGGCLAGCNWWSTSKKLVWGRISSFH